VHEPPSDPPVSAHRSRRRRLAWLGGLGAALAATLGAWVGALVLTRALGGWVRFARVAVRAATLNLHVRCPDCAGRLRAEARLCRHCGYRLAPKPRPRRR
jgi:DNA-directed RNA polymerase subunit RPC12/RpoP